MREREEPLREVKELRGNRESVAEIGRSVAVMKQGVAQKVVNIREMRNVGETERNLAQIACNIAEIE